MNPLQKVFSILETVVAGQDKGVTYTQIVTQLNLAKSTVHRILKDLTDLGYLTFNPETKRYFGNLRLAALGAKVMSSFEFRDHVRPHLISLHQDTGHTANLGVLDGTKGVFIDKIESRDFGIKLFSEIGKTFPLHCTGMGKALLAFSSGDLLAELSKLPLERVTPYTITDVQALKKELAAIRAQGYALDNQEITRGIMCIGAPVFGFDGDLAGAISITFPSYINEDRGIDHEIEAIQRYSSLVSKKLEYK
jgi:DNA-binding IclR family transcriptional regulator